MRKTIALSALAVGLAVTGCSNPVEESTVDSAASEVDAAADTAASEIDASEIDAATDTAASEVDAATSATEDMTAEGAISNQTIDDLQQQFPVMQAVPDEQIESAVSEVCTRLESQGMTEAQSVLESIPGMNTDQAQQVVTFLDENVCSAS